MNRGTNFIHTSLYTSASFQPVKFFALIFSHIIFFSAHFSETETTKEKAIFAKTWKMCTLAAVFVGEGSHDLQSADGGFTCCTGGAAKHLTPPPQIITAFSHHWPIHGYGERRRTKSPGWHLTSNSFKAMRGHGVISLLTVLWNDHSSEVVALSRPTGALNI